MRVVAIIKNNTVENVAVIGRGVDGDYWLDTFDGITVVPDQNDTYGELFLTLEGCIAIETTNLEVQPKIGWSYQNNVFTPPQDSL